MKQRSLVLAVVLVVLSVGCRLGPGYERPVYPVPGDFEAGEPEQRTLGELEWFVVFDDPVLQDLIKQALAGNYDLRIAAERVLVARSFVTISEADLYPELNAGARYDHMQLTKNGEVPIPAGVDRTQTEYSVFGDISWELDFWGRYASASEAARAELLATELGRRTVIQTLVCDLALAYFTLLALDEELNITERTYESRQKSFDLVSLRLDEGIANKVEYRQSESLVLETAGLAPNLERLIVQQENLIRFLIGGNPGSVPRGRSLLEQQRSFDVPVGLPSDLLTRRPDIMEAEQRLIAANARIGEARALLYPSIQLTALGGSASQDLDDLFDSGSGIWDLAPSVNLPIFNAGRLRSNVDVTESQQRQATLFYLRSLQGAFADVADALIAHEKLQEVRGWREKLVETLDDQLSLSNDRYLGGVTSYLEVLDTQRDHFESELSLTRSIRDELFASVFLYRALGGGWQGTENLAAQGEQIGASDVPPSQGSAGG